MKKAILLCVAASLMLAFTACQPGGQSGVSVKKNFELKTEQDSFSYIIGRDIAGSLRMFMSEINKDILFSAINEGLDTTKESRLDEMVERAVMMTVMTRLNDQAVARAQAETETNRTKGEEFLARNAERSEVTVTASGLQFEILEAGDRSSAKPTASSTVEVRYVGTLIDGTVFDRSRDGATARFPVSGVISGWTEGLQLMNVGSKFKFFIPPNLAYADRPLPGIGPNSTLIFEVELVNVINQ